MVNPLADTCMYLFGSAVDNLDVFIPDRLRLHVARSRQCFISGNCSANILRHRHCCWSSLGKPDPWAARPCSASTNASAAAGHVRRHQVLDDLLHRLSLSGPLAAINVNPLADNLQYRFGGVLGGGASSDHQRQRAFRPGRTAHAAAHHNRAQRATLGYRGRPDTAGFRCR